MLTTVLSEVKGLVDPRFLLTAFFPVLVFALVGGLLVVSANGGLDQAVTTWSGYSGGIQVIIVVGVMSGVFLAAAFASSNGVLLTQLYEGYLGPRWLRRLGVRTQTGRRAAATSDVDLRFPPEADLMPTTLGNVLAAAESYAGRAYGIDALVAWPRLFLLLPDSLLASATGPSDTQQFLLLTSLLSTVTAVVGGVYAAVASLGSGVYLAVVVGGFLLAWMCYRGAVEAAVEYGLHVRGAFDLHRNLLLTQLGRALPATKDEEHRTWADVCQRLRSGEPAPVRYVPAPPK